LGGENGSFRAFVCDALNEWGYPAKDRSGRLDTLEEPHLGKLIEKMGKGGNTEKQLNFVNPSQQILTEGTENVESK